MSGNLGFHASPFSHDYVLDRDVPVDREKVSFYSTREQIEEELKYLFPDVQEFSEEWLEIQMTSSSDRTMSLSYREFVILAYATKITQTTKKKVMGVCGIIG